MLAHQDLKSTIASTSEATGKYPPNNGASSSNQAKIASQANMINRARPNPPTHQNYNVKETNLSNKIANSLTKRSSFDADPPTNPMSYKQTANKPTNNPPPNSAPTPASRAPTNVQSKPTIPGNQQQINRANQSNSSNSELNHKLKGNEIMNRNFNGNSNQYGAPMTLDHPNRPGSNSSFGKFNSSLTNKWPQWLS